MLIFSADCLVSLVSKQGWTLDMSSPLAKHFRLSRLLRRIVRPPARLPGGLPRNEVENWGENGVKMGYLGHASIL